MMPEFQQPNGRETKEILSPSDFDRAISLTGFGWFNVRITLVCGGAILAAGLQSGLNAFVLPSARYDLDMDSRQMGILNASFLLGGIASAYVWGTLADRLGRKKVLMASLFMDAIVTIASSFSQTYGVFLAFRFINGFIIGAPSSLVFTYLGEFHTSNQGSRTSCYAGFFWTLSWMLLPGIAWLIIPLPWTFTAPGFTYNSWRVFVCAASIPSLISGLAITFQPESPCFLLSTKKTHEALDVLQHMFAVNSSLPSSQYPAMFLEHRLERAGNAFQDLHILIKSEGSAQTFLKLLKSTLSHTKEVFTPPLLKNMVLCCVLLFANMFGYFGLGLWLPEIFNRFERHYRVFPNISVSVCDLDHVAADVSCDRHVVDSHVFRNTLYVGASCLLANIVSGLVAPHSERRVLPVLTMMIAGGFGLSIYFVQTAEDILIISCIFQAAISSANFIISGIVVEIFPTRNRGMAICVAILGGRLGAITSNLLLGQLLAVNCQVPILLLGSVVVFGGFLSLLIPNGYKGTFDKPSNNSE